MDDSVKLTRHSAEELRRAVRRLKVLPQNAPGGRGDSGAGAIRWLPFKNNAGTDCPPFSCVQITGTTQLANTSVPMYVYTGDKPSTTFCRIYGVSHSITTKAGKFGFLTFDSGVRVAYDSGTPAFGEGWGPKAAQWTLSKNYPETALVIGIADSTNKYLYSDWHAINAVIGKFGSDVAKGSSGTFTVWTGAGGSEAASSVTISNVYSPMGAVTASKFSTVHWVNGVPYVWTTEC